MLRQSNEGKIEVTKLAQASAQAVVPVKDIDTARTWWVDTLGLTVVHEDAKTGLILEAGNGTRIVMYASEGAGVAPNTIVDFVVEDLESTVDSLVANGLTFERYDGLDADGRGIAEMGPLRCAWVNDPDGNSIAISQLVAVTA
jgi:catechol 2,3-dioxygenase-like lactoylglutathione lyase family enzyme